MGTSGSGTTGSGSGVGTGSGTTGSGAGMGTSGSGMSGMSGMQGMGHMQGMSATNMAAMQALQNATGAQFNSMFVSQMLAMHEAKLTELQAAATTLTDPELKLAVTKAIPKIRMHRDMLSRINNGGSTQGSTQQ
jgi:uncharacterized protein (DUF305 family)